MKVGKIKKIFHNKGYGFIVPEGGGLDVLFRSTNYVGDVPFTKLRRGDIVYYIDEVVNYRVRAKFVQYKIEQTRPNGGQDVHEKERKDDSNTK